jgi:hypothetical protein
VPLGYILLRSQKFKAPFYQLHYLFPIIGAVNLASLGPGASWLHTTTITKIAKKLHLHNVVPVIGVVWPTEFPYNTIQLCKHFTCNCRLGVLSHSCFKGVQFFSFRLLHQSFNSLRETGDFNNLLNHSFNKNIFPWLANLSNCVSKIHYHWQHSSGHPKFQIVMPQRITILPYEIKNCLNVICNSYQCISCWKRSGIADYN